MALLAKAQHDRPTLPLLFPQFWEITPRLTAHQGPATAYCIQFPGNRSSKGQAEKQLEFQIREVDLSVCMVSQNTGFLGPSAGQQSIWMIGSKDVNRQGPGTDLPCRLRS